VPKYPVAQAQKIIEDLDTDFLFLAISGAHLYGFESYNSDLDIGGCHFPDINECVRYGTTKDTFEARWLQSPHWDEEADIVSHSFLKYLYLITKQPNGYILE